ncbi:MAG: hypothetical protein IJD10_04825 [Clostridia bacterium]|nr:hypothetical protein [Clostridia bacterium]
MKLSWFKQAGVTVDLHMLTQREKVSRWFAGHKKGLIVFAIVIGLFFVLIIPYIRVEILTAQRGTELACADLSPLDYAYADDKVAVYDVKVYAYHKQESAKALFVIGNREFGIMAELRWDEERGIWSFYDGRLMWTAYGGSAHEFHWPLYNWDMYF